MEAHRRSLTQGSLRGATWGGFGISPVIGSPVSVMFQVERVSLI